MSMMRKIGLIFLVVSFGWLVADALFLFSSHQHMLWIWQSKNLPGDGPIPREEVVSVIREFSLDLNSRHKAVLFPACGMLGGGLILFWAPVAKRK